MKFKKPRIPPGSAPARVLLSDEVFQAMPKSVLAVLAYCLALPDEVAPDEADATARRRMLEMWDQVAAAGLPRPSHWMRKQLGGVEVGKMAGSAPTAPQE